MITKRVRKVAELRRLVQNGPPIRGFNGANLGGLTPGGLIPGGFAPGGFSPGGFASAPGGFTPSSVAPSAVTPAPLTPGIAGPGLSLAPNAGSILGLAGLVGGTIAIADDTSSTPPAASPSTTGS